MEARRVLLTGGAGLLGQAIVREMRKPARNGFAPPDEIRVYDVRAAATPATPGVVPIVGDVRQLDELRRACEGVDVVIHAASLVDFGHASEQALHAINVGGTENAIRACRESGVPALVYTSTMDVVLSGEAIANGDETLPYPEHFADAYAHTKALAEQTALAANGPELRTCAIRPCGMYGEADPYHVSHVLRLVQEGKLPARIGDGKAVFQHVYVGNVAHAHLLAMRHLLQEYPTVAGQTYIITDFPAINFFDFTERLVTPLGHAFPPASRSVPYRAAYALGALLEFAAKLLRPVVTFRPTLTRSSIRVVCNDLSFVGEKAAGDLGYEPVYSEAEALERTVEWFRAHGPVDPPEIPELR
jgi:sterol-4alpha-carboxylate 3-dehydrogenase (decarboxylating)